MILHVACLPFPSPQGTQAAVDAILRASANAGRRTHLLAYAHGMHEIDAPYTIHRIPDFPKVRSSRSGPSFGKLALDARCTAEIRKLVRELRPTAIVAHHIEAALAALAARSVPVFYVAHTSVEHELPVYFPHLPDKAVSAAARRVERQVCSRAAGVAAVAPSLAALLDDRTQYLPIPWPVRFAASGPSREQARFTLGLPLDAPVCLYAGNLDRYQGWEHLLQATALLRRTHPRARLLIATASDRTPARKEAERRGLAYSLRFCGLDSEPQPADQDARCARPRASRGRDEAGYGGAGARGRVSRGAGR